MEALLREIIGLLIRFGPEVVFIVTMAETAFFVGLVVPAEATVLLAAFLADRGIFQLEHVAAATLAGAFLGDQIGYALGRFGGARVVRRGGRIGRLWHRYEPRAAALFRRRSIVAVTLARFISFVRTLMPWFAGMSGVPYARFVFFDLLGVIGWGVASIAVGYAAGESWRRVADAVGATTTILLGALVAVSIFLYFRRRRSGRTASSPTLERAVEDSADPSF